MRALTIKDTDIQILVIYHCYLPISNAFWFGFAWRSYQYCQWVYSIRRSGSSRNERWMLDFAVSGNV